MRNLQIRRGLKKNVPNFELAELGYSTDTKELHIGNGDGTYTTFINEGQLDVKINAVRNVLEPKKTTLQQQFNNKVKLDNTPVDLDFIAQDNVINKIQVSKSEIDKRDYKFATRAEHVIMNNGIDYEKVYTGLLNNSAKSFTSSGEPIIIDNGISKQKILTLKITGDSVKNIAKTRVFEILDEEKGWKNKVTSVDPAMINTSTVYYIHVFLFNNSLIDNLIVSQSNAFNYYSCLKNMELISGGFIGYKKIKNLTIDDFSECSPSYGVVTQLAIKDLPGFVKCAICMTEEDCDLSGAFECIEDAKLGDIKTKVSLVNNNVIYNFYESAQDKLNNKVLTLGKNDTFEVLEDGTAILNRAGIITQIPKELIPVIPTSNINQIYLRSPIKPAKLEVTLPVNKIEENQARIDALKMQVSALATLLTT